MQCNCVKNLIKGRKRRNGIWWKIDKMNFKIFKSVPYVKIHDLTIASVFTKIKLYFNISSFIPLSWIQDFSSLSQTMTLCQAHSPRQSRTVFLSTNPFHRCLPVFRSVIVAVTEYLKESFDLNMFKEPPFRK